MTVSDDPTAILDRILAGTQTEADLAALRSLIVSGDRNVVQLGNNNINITGGQDIHIGDRIYQGSSAEAIREIIRQVFDEYDARKNAELEAKKNDYTRETVYSTLFPVVKMPRYIYGVPCKYNDFQGKEASQEIIYPISGNGEMYPFLLRSGMLFCFQNLNDPLSPFRQLVSNQNVERYEVREWWEDPEQMKWFVTLLNRSLNKLTGRKELNLDKLHHRYYFQPKESGQVLNIKYRPLNQSITNRNVVWQPITKKTKKTKPYWYHLAVALKFHRVSDEHWCLSIRPEMRVTKDGFISLDSKKIGSRVTRKKSKIFNYNLLSDVNFWRDFLSDGQPRIIFNFGNGQNIIVSTTMIQSEIEWPGIPEEYAKPFKNVEYQDDLFSWAALASMDAEDNEEFDSSDDWDISNNVEEEFEDEE